VTTETRDIQPAIAHLEAALEASCASLMALESARLADGQAAVGASAVREQISHAIASVRAAMAELRALHQVETSMFAFGFVLADPEWARNQARRRNGGGRQVRPRRTA
jgi:hypothetical protein